jgi:hypothetical protein
MSKMIIQIGTRGIVYIPTLSPERPAIGVGANYPMYEINVMESAPSSGRSNVRNHDANNTEIAEAIASTGKCSIQPRQL